MAKKPKRKLSTAANVAKARHKAQFMTIVVNGRQRKVHRPATIEGQPVHDFIRYNACPLWLHQNAMWELIADPAADEACRASSDDKLFWA